MTTRPAAGHPYVEAVNRAIDHALQGLDGPLPLDELAGAAAFSPFHFHRVFRALMGETPGEFVRRLRLERALSIMARTPDRPLTEVALACGFAGSSDFSRAFKQRHGVPPSRFDLDAWREERRAGLRDTVEASVSDGADPPVLTTPEGVRLERLPPGENPDGFEVTMLELPPRAVLYRRVFDPYHGSGVVDAATEFLAWADARGLADGAWLGYQWDDPEVVPLERCRYDVGLVVPEEAARSEGSLGLLRFPALLVACVPVRGGLDLETRALDWLYGTWLPESGYLPDDQPAFEAWVGRPFAHGFEHFEVDVHLPVRPR